MDHKKLEAYRKEYRGVEMSEKDYQLMLLRMQQAEKEMTKKKKKPNLGSFLEENKRIIEEIKSILKTATQKQETANIPAEPDLFTQNQAKEPQNNEENDQE